MFLAATLVGWTERCVLWVQTIERFVRGGDAASRQITLTTVVVVIVVME